jgi:hypothetical protein
MDSLFDSFMVGSQLSLACSQRSLRLPDTVDEDKVEASFGSEIVSFRSNVISHCSQQYWYVGTVLLRPPGHTMLSSSSKIQPC